jgi:TonB family protein
MLGGAKELFGAAPLNAQIDRALGQLKGPALGDAQGMAPGPRGFGPVGAGPSWGGDPLTAHPRVGGFHPGLERKPSPTPCCHELETEPGISKEPIAKVIRRHFSEIKFCYERMLQQKPELEGKVVLNFTFDGTGSVVDAAVSESTLEEPNVEECMLARVRRWKFPVQPGAGIVSVNHPWIFKPAGAD